MLAQKPQHLTLTCWSHPNSYFYEIRSWPSPHNEIQNLIFLLVCAHMLLACVDTTFLMCVKQNYFSHLALEHPLETYVRLCGEHVISEMVVWLMLVGRYLVLPRICWSRLLQIKHKHTYVSLLYRRFYSEHQMLGQTARTCRYQSCFLIKKKIGSTAAYNQ